MLVTPRICFRQSRERNGLGTPDGTRRLSGRFPRFKCRIDCLLLLDRGCDPDFGYCTVGATGLPDGESTFLFIPMRLTWA